MTIRILVCWALIFVFLWQPLMAFPFLVGALVASAADS